MFYLITFRKVGEIITIGRFNIHVGCGTYWLLIVWEGGSESIIHRGSISGDSFFE